MIKGDKEYLDQIVQTHQCSEHGAKLVAAWHAGENSYVIRCGEGHFPEEVTRVKSRTQEFKAGELEPVGAGLNLLPQTDLGTGELLIPEKVISLMEAKSPRDKTKLRSPVVAAHPWQLAQKRAEWQAMRRVFPIGESEDKKEV